AVAAAIEAQFPFKGVQVHEITRQARGKTLVSFTDGGTVAPDMSRFDAAMAAASAPAAPRLTVGARFTETVERPWTAPDGTKGTHRTAAVYEVVAADARGGEAVFVNLLENVDAPPAEARVPGPGSKKSFIWLGIDNGIAK